MRGTSKAPTSRGRNIGEGARREPNVFEKINQAHVRHRLEKQMTVASRAATAPDVSDAKKPAATVTGNWLQRAAEATTQRLRRTFGRYLHLTPDGTAEISRVAPIAHEPLRIETPQRGPTSAEPDMQKVSVQQANGIAAQHTTLHALDGGTRAAPRDYQPTKAVSDFLATGSQAPKSPERATQMQEAAKQARPTNAGTNGKDQAAHVQNRDEKAREKDGGVGRGIEE